MAPPNFSDKNTMTNPPKMRDKLCAKHMRMHAEVSTIYL